MRKTRNYNDEEKRQIIEEAKSSGNVAAVARKNDVPVGTVHSWLSISTLMEPPISTLFDPLYVA